MRVSLSFTVQSDRCQTHTEVHAQLGAAHYFIPYDFFTAHSCVFLSLCQSCLCLLTCLFHCGLSSCQWMGDRVMASQSTSSLYSSPSPSSDWSARRRERSSPLRGPHGKFVSPSSICGYASSSSSPQDQNTPQRSRGERHTDMAELAKHVSLSLEA